MDIIWEFSFFLTQQTEKLVKLFPTYLGNNNKYRNCEYKRIIQEHI